MRPLVVGLERYSQRKGLLVNTKSKVIVFNTRKVYDAEFWYRGTNWEQLSDFNYLCVIFNRDGKMRHADHHGWPMV